MKSEPRGFCLYLRAISIPRITECRLSEGFRVGFVQSGPIPPLVVVGSGNCATILSIHGKLLPLSTPLAKMLTPANRIKRKLSLRNPGCVRLSYITGRETYSRDLTISPLGV